jgi:hypothetical protein
MDNAYYNKAISASPIHALPGYIMGGLSWFVSNALSIDDLNRNLLTGAPVGYSLALRDHYGIGRSRFGDQPFFPNLPGAIDELCRHCRSCASTGCGRDAWQRRRHRMLVSHGKLSYKYLQQMLIRYQVHGGDEHI